MIDSFLDECLKSSRTCTHTHTCNPPGPDAAHTHTCYHTHTQVITSEDDHSKDKEHSKLKPRRPAGNREAVRKYREKKKAHTAYLEEEAKKLRLMNQQLVKKLQGQAILEAEILRLRSLLVELKGNIDNEMGRFPFQKQRNTSTVFKDADCGVQIIGGAVDLQCQTDMPCFHPHDGSSWQVSINGGSGDLLESWERNCQPAIIDCRANTS
ncbi:bZIP_2 domain-containing protein [Cephalotus follicularis]|uniref:BZIP_2 domain-containing protein n=1 Tax=Cephalotus follicularis TaxID=3775 RepID=A0A1Q3BNE6_CEPFO|nr:bZIP_2 domain-containing protein [Cephalotus follicularis]